MNFDKRYVLGWVFGIITGALVAAVLLIACWMLGNATHDSDVLRHDQQISCLNAGGVPTFNSGRLECHKS